MDGFEFAAPVQARLSATDVILYSEARIQSGKCGDRAFAPDHEKSDQQSPICWQR